MTGVSDSEALQIQRRIERDLAGAPRPMSPGVIAADVMPIVRRVIEERGRLIEGNHGAYLANLKQWSEWTSELMEIADLRYGGDDTPTMRTILDELWVMRRKVDGMPRHGDLTTEEAP